MKCRHCQTELTTTFVDLKTSPPSNSFLTADQLDKPEAFYPLHIHVCEECFLVQIDEFKNAHEIFSNDYVYFSSISKSWLAHCKKYSEQMIERFGLDSNNQVVEVASNDGYLLQYFHQQNIPVLGIEPTGNTADAAIAKGIESVKEFFGEEIAHRLKSEGRGADLLIGNNVLAHVPDINDFVKGLKAMLNEEGVITMEFPHLMQLVANNQFDTIYHEHFSYLSLTTVSRIFESFGLQLFDVEEIPTHGGSLRIYGKHAEDSSKEVSNRYEALLEKEKSIGMTTLAYYEGFQGKSDKVKDDLLEFLKTAKAEGKSVVGYGAAAKGNTLLNYCEVGTELIQYVVDASPHKQGKYLPGCHIPVVDESELRQTKPDYILILPWNIKDEIINQLSYTQEWGAEFMVAIPELSKV
ncbi:class I SAM-dependent methyltransferase [bacterium SCSIO 12741]|nr:class I SAM-dependent methyltransferase [bacterium SCSIO 12741]